MQLDTMRQTVKACDARVASAYEEGQRAQREIEARAEQREALILALQQRQRELEQEVRFLLGCHVTGPLLQSLTSRHHSR